MSKTTVFLRVLLGIILLVFGLNGILASMGMPLMSMPEMPKEAQQFMGALMGTGYLMMVIKLLEVITGFLLIINRFVPLALVLIAPDTVNILLFHLFLAPAGIPGYIVFILNVYLLFAYKPLYNPMLQAKPDFGHQQNS